MTNYSNQPPDHYHIAVIGGTAGPLPVTSNSRLLGTGPAPFQITPDGTCIRLAALRVRPSSGGTPVPLNSLHPGTLIPNHIASGGRITLTTTNTAGQKIILQITPANDFDSDGIPDDFEKHLARQLLAFQPDAAYWGAYYAGLAQGNLDATHDYTGDGIDAGELYITLKPIPASGSPDSEFLVEPQSRRNSLGWAYYRPETPGDPTKPGISGGSYFHSRPCDFDEQIMLTDHNDFTSAYLTSRIDGLEWSHSNNPAMTPWFPNLAGYYSKAVSGFLEEPVAGDPTATSYRGYVRQKRFRVIATHLDHEPLAQRYLKIEGKSPYGEMSINEVLAAEPVSILIPKGRFLSDWFEFEAPMVEGQDTVVNLLPVDLDFIKPGTEKDASPEEIAEDKEDSEGEVVGINWDDDNNSEGDGGHGKLVFKNDYDDANGTAGEDDLIQLKLHKPAIDGMKARLKYDSAFVKIWLKEDRKEEVKSEETEIELTEDKIVYLEGRKLTEAEEPKEIEIQIKVGAAGAYVTGDKVSVHVATPIITFQGKLWDPGSGGYASNNLANQLHNKQLLGKNRRDDRNNTVILKGENQQGKTLWYSVDMFDITPSEEGDKDLKRPEIRVRLPNLDKEMKMALSLEGAHVYYDGHSNFGLGPNFNVGSTATVDDYMNLSGRGITAITLKSTDPEDAPFGGNAMKNPAHGGPDFALRPADIPGQATNYLVPFLPNVTKFTGPAVGAVLTRQDHADGTPYHYERQGTFITIVNSSGDVPALR